MTNIWLRRLLGYCGFVLFLACASCLTACPWETTIDVPSEPTWLTFDMDADVGLEPSMYPGGPDLNGDELVDALDVELLTRALETGEGLDPAMDVNRDGMLDWSDLEWLQDVIEPGRPALVSVDFLLDDEEAGEPLALELEGFGFDPDMEILVGETARKPDAIELWEVGPATAWLFYESLEQAPTQDSPVLVETERGPSQILLLDVLIDIIGDQDESTALDEPLLQQAPEGDALAAPKTDCCIKWIKFRGVRSGVRIFAFDDGGNPAGKNGPTLKSSKTATLTSDARTVSILVVERGVLVASFTFNCDNLKKGIFSEPMPDTGEGGTAVRPRQLFEIVDFNTGPCKGPAASIPKDLRVPVVPYDNKDWPKPTPHKGSGALAKLSVPLSSLADLGCKAACWAQTVSTTVDKWNHTTKKWKTLSKSKPHIDNLNADPKPGGKPWYCYGAEFTADGPNGKVLVLGDGPHLVHSGTYWLGGKKVQLVKGDVIRRRSVFISQLICYDPQPASVLVSLLWSVTTVYTHDPDDLGKGGKTKTSAPVVVNITKVPGKKDLKTLKKYLKKKARDRKKRK